jgi:hypothetical protein
MNTDKNGAWSSEQQIERSDYRKDRDRRGLIGLLSLFGAALPALGIRFLFPDLNPLFLVGLGVAVYGVYLGLLAYYSFQSNDDELATEPVISNARDRRLVNDD